MRLGKIYIRFECEKLECEIYTEREVFHHLLTELQYSIIMIFYLYCIEIQDLLV